MSRCRALLVLPVLVLLAATSARAEKTTASDRAFVEIVVTKDAVFVGEPVRVSLRIKIDRAFFEQHAVPLFRQRMDVPVQVTAPWLDTLPEAIRLEADAGVPRETLRLALGDRMTDAVRLADERRDGRAFTVLEIPSTWLVEAPGEIALAAPTLRFAWATRFEEDFLGDRTAVDRRDEQVRGAPRTLGVMAWPEAGRPETFVDAVGHFTVRAEATAGGRDAPWKLTLTIEGEGNLSTLTPPAAERIVGFHVYGALDEKHPSRRTITYDLAPAPDGTTRIPAIPFAFLDPGPPARYEVVTTDPIPLGVPDASANPPGAAVIDDLRGWKLKLLGFGLIVFVVLATVVLRGMRRSTVLEDPADRVRERVSEAADALRHAVEHEEIDLEARLTEYLAARLDTAPAAVITPDLASRLARAGLDPQVAARTASIVERLVSARYGGAPATDERLDATFVDRLESSWPPITSGA